MNNFRPLPKHWKQAMCMSTCSWLDHTRQLRQVASPRSDGSGWDSDDQELLGFRYSSELAPQVLKSGRVNGLWNPGLVRRFKKTERSAGTDPPSVTSMIGAGSGSDNLFYDSNNLRSLWFWYPIVTTILNGQCATLSTTYRRRCLDHAWGRSRSELAACKASQSKWSRDSILGSEGLLCRDSQGLCYLLILSNNRSSWNYF